MIKIIGTYGNISDVDDFLSKIEFFSKNYKISIQAFDADMIFGKDHILSAVEHAVRSINQKTNTTNSFEMEILLYASGERQLKLAIPKMGVKSGKVRIALVLIGDNISEGMIKKFISNLSLNLDDNVLNGDIDTLKKFGLKDDEIKTVAKDKYGNLILEKVALVDIIK